MSASLTTKQVKALERLYLKKKWVREDERAKLASLVWSHHWVVHWTKTPPVECEDGEYTIKCLFFAQGGFCGVHWLDYGAYDDGCIVPENDIPSHLVDQLNWFLDTHYEDVEMEDFTLEYCELHNATDQPLTFNDVQHIFDHGRTLEEEEEELDSDVEDGGDEGDEGGEGDEEEEEEVVEPELKKQRTQFLASYSEESESDTDEYP